MLLWAFSKQKFPPPSPPLTLPNGHVDLRARSSPQVKIHFSTFVHPGPKALMVVRKSYQSGWKYSVTTETIEDAVPSCLRSLNSSANPLETIGSVRTTSIIGTLLGKGSITCWVFINVTIKVWFCLDGAPHLCGDDKCYRYDAQQNDWTISGQYDSF